MAKKITPADPVATEAPQEIAADTSTVPETLEPKTASPKTTQEIPEHADRILKTLTTYPKLYIDFQGGIFTADTPPAFRANATLYTNPYYRKP